MADGNPDNINANDNFLDFIPTNIDWANNSPSNEAEYMAIVNFVYSSYYCEQNGDRFTIISQYFHWTNNDRATEYENNDVIAEHRLASPCRLLTL